MKTLALLIALWTLSLLPSSSQNWVQVGDLNDTPRVFLNDTTSGLLYLSGNFRLNGIDTLDGLSSFDGNGFTSLGRRSDCSHFDCNPGFLIARYENHIYFSCGGLSLIDSVAVQGIARWDGAHWEPAMPGLAGNENPYLDGYCIHQGLFYGVGLFRTAEGDTCNSVAYWDGQKWTGLGFIPYPEGTLPRVYKVIFYQNQLYVGGNFSWEYSGGQDIARLTNNGWELVGGGLLGGAANVFDMKVYKGELYICGYFRSADGNVGNKIMRWNGQEWRKVGDGFCSQNIIPTQMMVHNGKLYVVGIFDCVENNISASNIATWDGERWCNLGNSYFNNTISCITSYKGDIYVGGGFTMVDGQPCKSMAKWVGDEQNVTCSEPVSATEEPQTGTLQILPNPGVDYVTILLPELAESDYTLSLFDATGHALTNFRRKATPGKNDPIRLEIAHIPSGLYYVIGQSKDKIFRGKFIKI